MRVGYMVEYDENTGDSTKSAIRIMGAKNSLEGTFAEYDYRARKFGKMGKDFRVSMQFLMEKGGKHYDALDVVFPDGRKSTVYFDVSEHFGKK
jgi:hypothetical protein